jgi:hypothetical protein
VIGNNSISNIGNIGIRFGGVGIIIERNQVTNAMTNMDDGGGIYTWGGNNSSYSNTIRNNIVDNLVGNHNGSAPGNIINGIYIDNDAYSITVQNNTVKNVLDGSGIIINAGAHDCVVSGNVTYKCKQGLGFAFPLQIASNDNNYTTMTSCNNNFLCNPYSSNIVSYLWSSPRNFTLAQWRTATGFDAASVGSYYTWTSPTDNSFLVTNNTTAAVIYNYTNVKNLNNQSVTSLTLQPFTSQVLINLAVLPVELLDFSGYTDFSKSNTEGYKNYLNWQTAIEINTTHFIIERSSEGKNFENIGQIKAKGAYSNYNFTDDVAKTSARLNPSLNPSLNTSNRLYYRLKIVDLDGKTTFSKVISLENDFILRGIKIYPNPVSDVLTIQNADNQPFDILNILGQKVLSGHIGHTINASNLVKGTYILKMNGQQTTLVKQ